MPDLCLCTGNCPVRENCYRYMGKPNPYGQTFSSLEEVCIPNDYSELIPCKDSIIKEEKERSIDYTLEDFLLEEIHKAMDETN